MAERELAILLTARNLASKGIRNVTTDVNKLGKAGRRVGPSLKTIGVGVGALAGGAALFVATSVKSGLDSLVTLEAANATTQAVINSTGGAAKVSADEVRNWAEEIEKATGAAVDDKAIQAAENVLLRSGAVTHDMFQRVAKDAVDLGAAMKTGPEGGAKTLAKALANPIKAVGALRKAGIFLTAAEEERLKGLYKYTKAQQAEMKGMKGAERARYIAAHRQQADAQAQVLILGKVEQATKDAAAASAGPLQRSQNMLADAWEDAKMALATGFLPVITRVGDTISKELGKPETIRQIRDLGQGLADGFDRVLDVVSKIPWGSVKDAMSTVGTGAKAAAGFFTGLPPWVQTAVLTGWGFNKLTGGVVSDVFSAAATGLIKGVLGMNAGVVNINAAVVNGGAGIPGVPGGGGLNPVAAGAGMTGAAALGIGGGALLLGLVGAVNSPLWVRNQTISTELEQKGLTQPERAAQLYYQASASDQAQMRKHLAFLPTKADFESGNAKLKAVQQSASNTEANAARNAASQTAAASRAAGQQAAAAIKDKDLSVSLAATVKTNVTVSARQASHQIVTTQIRQDGSGVLHNGAN